MEAISGSITAVCYAVDITAGYRVPDVLPTLEAKKELSDDAFTPPSANEGNTHIIDPSQISLPVSPPSKTSPFPHVPRTFVAIRPPGHHCGDETPSGFCFVNNVLIGAAHG